MEIDEEDKIVRVSDKFMRHLFLRLGQALDPQMEVAKAHAASMDEAANAWQQKAIKAIQDAVAGVKKDNRGVVQDIMDESWRNTKELKFTVIPSLQIFLQRWRKWRQCSW